MKTRKDNDKPIPQTEPLRREATHGNFCQKATLIPENKICFLSSERRHDRSIISLHKRNRNSAEVSALIVGVDFVAVTANNMPESCLRRFLVVAVNRYHQSQLSEATQSFSSRWLLKLQTPILVCWGFMAGIQSRFRP